MTEQLTDLIQRNDLKELFRTLWN